MILFALTALGHPWTRMAFFAHQRMVINRKSCPNVASDHNIYHAVIVIITRRWNSGKNLLSFLLVSFKFTFYTRSPLSWRGRKSFS